MFSNVLKAIFGSRNDRLLKQYRKSVDFINALEPAIEKLSDEALAAKTPEFRARVAGGTPLEEVLPEAFAVVREAGKRVLGMRHFDVQLIGGMVLHKDILKPRFDFSLRVLNAHKKIYEALKAGNAAQARREMSQHLQEVEEDLLTIQKQKKIRGLVLSLDRGFRLQKEVMPDKGRTSKSKKKARVIDLDN